LQPTTANEKAALRRLAFARALKGAAIDAQREAALATA
jgi:hypothetical protein